MWVVATRRFRNGYKFDTGPTFLMMKFILDEVFEEAGRHIGDYLNCVKLEPMYRLQFEDMRLEPTTDARGDVDSSTRIFQEPLTATTSSWRWRNAGFI